MAGFFFAPPPLPARQNDGSCAICGDREGINRLSVYTLPAAFHLAEDAVVFHTRLAGQAFSHCKSFENNPKSEDWRMILFKLLESFAAFHMSFCFSAYIVRAIRYPAVVKMDQHACNAQFLLKRSGRQGVNGIAGADCLRRGNPGSLTG